MIEFLKELTRRKVWLFGGLYLGAAWILLQVAIAIESTLELPNWVDQSVLVFLVIGFPACLLLAWAQDSSATETERSAMKDPPDQLKTPGRPSLVILPFDNFSEGLIHASQIDGLVEDLTTMLGRNPELKIIARNSAFQYRGQFTDIQQACKALGADFAAEGSLRVRGEQIRLNIQLVEASHGHHLWADTIDLTAADFDAELDDLVLKLAMKLTAEVTRGSLSSNQSERSGTEDAWTEYISSRAMITYKGYTASTVIEVQDRLRRAITLDPDFAEAHALLGLTIAFSHMIGLVPPNEERQLEALDLGQRALALAPTSSAVLGFVGCAFCDLGRHNEGVPLIERALEIDRTNAQAYAALGASKIVTRSDVEGGIANLERALSLIPDEVGNAIWRTALASAYCSLGRFDDGLAMAQQAFQEDPNYLGSRLVQLAALLKLDRKPEAIAIAEQLEADDPQLSSATVTGVVGLGGTELIRASGLLHKALGPSPDLEQ